jgi:hypothetical protein
MEPVSDEQMKDVNREIARFGDRCSCVVNKIYVPPKESEYRSRT